MLEELRKAVYEANLELPRRGLVTYTWGNVSGIDRSKGLMVIKPSGVEYSALRPEDLVVLDMNGNSVEGALRELSEEVGIHASKEELHLIHSICLKERFVDTYITRQKVNLEDLKLQAEEVVDAKFVVFDELMEMWRQGIVVPKSRFLLYKDKIESFIRPS